MSLDNDCLPTRRWGLPVFVYVIAASPAGPSKIGVAAEPRKRLGALQTGSHVPLSLHYVEPIGDAAATVEREVHRALATKRCSGGSEWFNVAPEEARIVIRAAAAAADVLIDDAANLHELQTRSVLRWLEEQERYATACAERGEDDSDELDDVTRPCVLRLLAGTVGPPSTSRHNFNDYLFSWEEGMWLRWAFERMGRRMPSGRSLKPYLEADDILERQGAVFGRQVSSRWIEWSTGRDLRRDEARALAVIWDRFVPLHNLIECKGPQWATFGIDDHVDDVHLFALTGDEKRGDRSCAVFSHEDFRAVLVPKRRVELHHIDLSLISEVRPLKDVPVSGFVAPAMPSDIWERPFLPWLRSAPERRDIALAHFLGNPAKRFPAPRPYDGPQPATQVWVDLPCIAADGTF